MRRVSLYGGLKYTRCGDGGQRGVLFCNSLISPWPQLISYKSEIPFDLVVFFNGSFRASRSWPYIFSTTSELKWMILLLSLVSNSALMPHLSYKLSGTMGNWSEHKCETITNIVHMYGRRSLLAAAQQQCVIGVNWTGLLCKRCHFMEAAHINMLCVSTHNSTPLNPKEKAIEYKTSAAAYKDGNYSICRKLSWPGVRRRRRRPACRGCVIQVNWAVT